MAEGSTKVQVLDRVSQGALAEIVGSEMDRMIETAKRFPRKVSDCQAELKQLACASDEVAESCLYTLERKEKGGGKKFIVGASVRFAELLAYSWGNLRFAARVIEEGREFVVAQGICYDLQRNTGASGEVRRRITTSEGHRFSTDMIGVTSGAACSIAMRNAIFDAIPESLWRHVWEAARAKAVGTKGTLKQRVDRAIEFFVKAGADEAQIYPALGVEKRSDLTIDHLAILTGLRTALKENAIAIDRMFHPDAHEERKAISLRAEEDEFSSIDSKVKPKAEAGGKPPKAKRGAKGEAPDTPPAGGANHEADASAAARKPDPATSGAGEDSETDIDLVARVQREHRAAPSTSKSRPIKAAKAALQRIAKGDDGLAKSADKLLNLYDLEEPQD